MATTHAGPIGIDSINNDFYVLGPTTGFNTIQAAVDFVRVHHSGLGNIVICHGHGYTEDISKITGGGISIVIEDQRDGNFIAYRWNGTSYGPNDFVQYAAIIAQSKIVSSALPGSTAMEYDPVNPAVNGHGQINVLAKPGLGMPFMSLVLTPQDGVTPAHAILQGTAATDGTVIVKFPEKVIIAPPDPTGTGSANLWMGQSEIPGGKGMAVTAQPPNNNIVFQGQTVGGAFDQDININPQGGDVQIGMNASITEAGHLTAVSIAADSGTVAGSPIVTFENIGSVGGMVWPPVGVPVSVAGGAWGASINPASLATYPPAGIPQSTGTAWGTPINPANLATWPGAGLAVSTGSAWGTPINPADVPRLSAANTFAADQTITGNLTASGVFTTAGGGLRILDSGLGQNTGTPNISTDRNNIFFNSTNGSNLFFNWNQGGSVIFGDGAGHNVASVDSSGNVTTPQLFTPIIKSNGANLRIEAPTGQPLYLNYASGASVQFCNGAAAVIATIFANGNATFTGTLTAGTKSFLIPHPLDETKDLVHSCLEGPEVGVFYRGEGVTTGGWAEVALPDYFEALTMPEGRTVMLTALFEQDDEPISSLAASRVKDGKFRVWSGVPTQKFYWEVKAVRSDVEPLETAPPRTQPHVMQPPPEEEPTPTEEENGKTTRTHRTAKG